ncbi:BppU family phage baseplate upper protein [Bacillus cereus group sp. BfR-BA-01029]|uniref:BppU family phage baseplate upper protein n=1 Tax=Bacillus cereus group sp. BfR-BA-01029 TaxID=3094873 RepID=UPI0029C3C4CA|nr:BppU family phage baseplate upper protein [Bacillus cereus group sp. BfR-BA-01029]MDX5910255.1 BppU family phage baseplate upper protein [Bacillus cereus group sp. BfR-BA-01029]
MKIKLVLDINKTQQAQLNAVVTGRQGDKETVTVNVFIVDSGVPYNLTGQDIYYEGLKPNNAYVRDKTGVKMINATQGNFEYTFRPETFGVAGVGRRSYFSIEQGGTVRASTQDFGLVTLADAMTGNTMSGPYISELEELINLAQWLVDDINSRWTSINTQLTQLQNKLNTMDVVKRSGDTMTGNLNMSNEKSIGFLNTSGARAFDSYLSSGGTYYMRNVLSNKAIYSINSAGFFDMITDTNLLKKTGGDLTGEIRHMGSGARVRLVRDDGKAALTSGTDGGNNAYAWNEIANKYAWKIDATTGKFDVMADNLVSKAKDGRADLVLTADATAFDPSTPSQVDRRGNAVTLRLAVRRNTGSTSDIVANLPVDMRPTMLNISNVIANDGTPLRVMVESGGAIKINITNKDVYAMITYVVN